MDDQATQRMLGEMLAYVRRNNGYLARAEIDALLAGISADKKRLEPFGFKVYSQSDEDGIIEEIFNRLSIDKGTFIEIGVENGLQCNTLYLIHKGWQGCWVEGNANQQPYIMEKFRSIIPNRLRPHFRIVTAENINSIIGQIHPDHSELDFLSIDIDGNDIYILESIDIRPKVLCVEYNAKFPARVSKQQAYNPDLSWGFTDYMGSSLKAVADVADKKGYRLVGTNISGVNAFFVRNDLAGQRFCDDHSPAHLYNPARYWLAFDHFSEIGHPADFGDYVDLMD